MPKNRDSAIASLVFGLLSWIPLLNWGISVLAVYFGVLAIRNMRKDREAYVGMALAIIGIVIGVAVIFFNLTWFFFFRPDALFPLNATLA